jgi:hypothetical protein
MRVERGLVRARAAAALRASGALLAVVLVVAAGCGRLPPEGFWEPSAGDSAAILGWVESNRSLFSAAFNDDSLRACDTILPGTTATRLRGEIAENPFKQRFRHNALEHRFLSEGHVFKPSFIATVDTVLVVTGGESTWVRETTATVTVVESLPGRLRLRAFSYTKYLRDSLFFPNPGETLVLPFFEQAFSPINRVVEKEFAGANIDGAVLRKSGGVWSPWKWSGGSRFYAPNANDAPYVVYMGLVAKRVGEADTTLRLLLRPDTLNYGMQRFYTSEELPTFKVGDSLTIRQSGVLSTIGDVAAYVYFRGRRYEFLTSRSDRVPLTEPGVFTLYATQTPIAVLYEVEGDRLELDPEVSGAYVGTVWGIRIRVVEQ